MDDLPSPKRRARPEQLFSGEGVRGEQRQRSDHSRNFERDRHPSAARTRRRIDYVQLVIVVFAVIGLGTTGVFAFRWLTSGAEGEPTTVARSSLSSDEFVADLEFTPEALREAVEEHGVQCDGGWNSDENGAQVCAGERGRYAVVDEPIERVLDGYVSGPLLVDSPDHYMIATPDAALIVPREDMGWLYKVWDDCAECYGWMTNGGRTTSVEFTVDGLREAADDAVGCQWNEHNLGLSTCVYTGDGGASMGANVFDQPSDGLINEFHNDFSTTVIAGEVAFQYDTRYASRFVSVPMMRACQVAGPCYVTVGDGDTWEFAPKTPPDVEAFFAELAAAYAAR